MPSHARPLLALIALFALILAACSGGGGTTTSDDDFGTDGSGVYQVAPGDNDEPVAVVREPGDGEALPPGSALALSAERIDEVESMRGEFEMTFDFGGLSLGMSGEYASRFPNDTYMTMELFGETIEMLFLPPDVYFLVPGEGWYGGQIDDMGVDWEALAEYAEQQGPFDYRDIANELHGVEQLPDETIDGVTYLHYGGDLDLARLYDDVPEGLFDPAMLEGATDMIDTVHVEIWLYADTYLPYRTDMTMEFSGLEDLPAPGSFAMVMSLVMSEYNEDVVIPDPPATYRPLDLLP